MIKSISLKKLRPKLPSVIRDIDSKMDRFIVTKRGLPKAIMMSIDDYESLLETLNILSSKGLLNRLKHGQSDVKGHRTKSLQQLEKELGIA